MQVDYDIRSDIIKHFNFDELIIDLLLAKNITEPFRIYKYFYNDLAFCYSPYYFENMYLAINTLKKIKDKNGKIGIFTDSDIDGLTSLTIIAKLFDMVGIDYCFRFPVNNEYYGLTNNIIDEFKNKKIDLLLTLDSGINDIEEINYAKSLGMDVIVCDHHECNEVLPDAIVINPKTDKSYVFKDLAGVGVAFKLAQAFLLSYTKYYNKYILIALNNTNHIDFAVVKDGVVRQQNRFESINDLNSKIATYNDNYLLFHKNFDDRIIKQNNCYNIDNLINIDKNNFLKLDEIEIFDNPIDCYIFKIQQLQNLQSKNIQKYFKDVLPLVAIGTIADMMPLVDENRILVHKGMEYFNESKYPCIKSLSQHFKKDINSEVIGWNISPLLNTPGRFGKTNMSANFFMAKDENEANSNLKEIISINEERKKMINEAIDKFCNNIDTNGMDICYNNFVFYIDNNLIPGLTGIIANKISEITDLPAIVIADDGSEILKGSGRIKQDFDFFDVLSKISNIFDKVGGHKQAFGFSIKRENIKILKNELLDYFNNFKHTFENKIQYDLQLSLSEVNFNTLEKLSYFEPYGILNEHFKFFSPNTEVLKYYSISNGKHMKFVFQGSINLEGIAWGVADKYDEILKNNKFVNIIYLVKTNDYNGNVSPQIEVLDIYV